MFSVTNFEFRIFISCSFQSINLLCFFFLSLIICSDLSGAGPEKEVEDDAPKVVDEEITSASVVENGKSEEAEPKLATEATEATESNEAAPENGSTEAEKEVTSTPAAEKVEDVAEEAKNGNSTGMIPFHFN